jgi:hypothetical protein
MRQVRLIALAIENVRRYSNGLALLNVVTKPEDMTGTCQSRLSPT